VIGVNRNPKVIKKVMDLLEEWGVDYEWWPHAPNDVLVQNRDESRLMDAVEIAEGEDIMEEYDHVNET
jgi:hypothetical protein